MVSQRRSAKKKHDLFRFRATSGFRRTSVSSLASDFEIRADGTEVVVEQVYESWYVPKGVQEEKNVAGGIINVSQLRSNKFWMV